MYARTWFIMSLRLFDSSYYTSEIHKLDTMLQHNNVANQTEQNDGKQFLTKKHEYEMHKLTEDYMIVSPWFENVQSKTSIYAH